MLLEPVSTELSFRHDGDQLVGDLVRPPGPGPYPAVVFVEGSGPGGRDLGEWPTRLAAAGFASLAYDKPGSGASTGDWTRQRLTDRAEETLAAVRALRRQPDVRADAVALIGHSQGGWVAPLAASRSDLVAAVVCVSGPGVGVLAQEEYRLRHQLPAAGLSCTRPATRTTRSWCSPAPTTTSGSAPAVPPDSTNVSSPGCTAGSAVGDRAGSAVGLLGEGRHSAR
ncbi:alpha/beta hydrolase family protein [Micromonospora andamanensis]|uniref:alpha/beta hydrolase family protein n=1 Tax=Micromonospora andamanensis TaxID=1287068 RepID=UPI00194DB9D5|nr:alpha/beta fold hydrolase [Micromonospora andamanensis]GIJ41610.1 hypothetical protein Vwe01_49350 [Micromonospora andamanensis]